MYDWNSSYRGGLLTLKSQNIDLYIILLKEDPSSHSAYHYTEAFVLLFL